MKKVLSIALLLALLVAVAVPTTFAQDGDELATQQGVVLTSSNLALRAEPSLDGEVLATLGAGDVVDVFEVEGIWARVRYTDADGNVLNGYVFESNLDISPAALNATGTISTSSSQAVRTAPDLTADVITTLDNGATVGVLQIQGIWAQVYTGEAVGWTFVADVNIDPASSAASDFLTDLAETNVSSELAVRATPNITGDVVTTLEDAAQVRVLGESEDGLFSYVRTEDGTLGWVFSADLSILEPRAVGSGTTTQNRVLFRAAPVDGEIIGDPLAAGTEVLIIDVTDDFQWFEVRIDGQTGYVSSRFVETDAYDLTIAGIASNSEDFSTLMEAVLAADPSVAEALAGEGALTVFAPTNDAFAALGDETLNAVLADQEQLTNILLYHVVDGTLLASDVVALAGDNGITTVNTLLGEPFTITIDGDGNVFINGTIQIVGFDIVASNGVIHVIDGVILPASE